MDVPRHGVRRLRRVRQAAGIGGAILIVVVISVAVGRLEPALQTTPRASVWIDTVKRGPLVREVRGTGTLVPQDIRWIPARTEGRVERIRVRPGAAVTPDTILLELSNPELEQSVLEAELQLKGAEAVLASRRAELESALLTQRAAVTLAEAEHRQASLQATADATLAADGLTSELTRRLSESRATQLAAQLAIEQERLEIASQGIAAQLQIQEAEVARIATLHALRERQAAALQVRAGTAGIVQQIPIDVGQRVAAGANLARVGDPSSLIAELRIPETQARDIQPGQPATVDTRNGIGVGRVARVDPAAQNGTVLVDVAFDGPLPDGARPDLTVEGIIEIERLADVVFVGRPARGQEGDSVQLFRLEPDGATATRVQVSLGRQSVRDIEVLAGLEPGDRVILSDLSALDEAQRIRLEP